MKLQKLTEKRWFWPLVCAVSVVFGWWYLSIVTCAPLGGDDELINLQNYYYITHTSFGQSVLDYIGDLWTQFSLQQGRFRPFSSPPVRGLTSWFLGDLVGYRLYILAEKLHDKINGCAALALAVPVPFVSPDGQAVVPFPTVFLSGAGKLLAL